MDTPLAKLGRQVDSDPRPSRIAQAAVPYLVGSAAKGDKMNVPPASRTDSRTKILEEIRAATRTTANSIELSAAYDSIPRTYQRTGRMGAAERVALMIERLREYDADVVETNESGLAATITLQLKASGRRRFVAPQ